MAITSLSNIKGGFIPVIYEIARVVCDVPFVLIGARVKFLNLRWITVLHNTM
jgi:hypothetical protein